MNYRSRRIVYISIQAGAILFLGGGLASMSPWLAGGTALLLAVGLMVYLNRPTAWLSALLLIVFTLAAVMGIWQNAPPLLMLMSVSFALAGWEISDFATSNKPVENRLVEEFEKRRLIVLAGVVCSSLILAGILLLVKFTIPFAVIFAAGGIALFSLFRLYRLFKG